ncbi:MAG TPA: Asp23/Gls24 family envelope stress response protein [Roseiflexaceae bacterium]|nr:Asp23/Gls24 family envelope stress response protein [Roseiflexaceae bacterium]
MATQAIGSVTVAPNVLVNLVVLGLREVPGIARPGHVPRVHAAHRGEGVALQIDGGEVSVDCYLIARPDTNLLELGIAAQATVAAVVRELAGMIVREVNVYIQDVEATSG